MADSERGPRLFSIKQVLSIIALVIPMSGAGGAWTATARDTIQDDAIEQLKGRVEDVTAEQKKTTRELIEVQGQVKALGDKMDVADKAAEKRVDEIKEDVKGDIAELRGLVIRALQRPAQ